LGALVGNGSVAQATKISKKEAANSDLIKSLNASNISWNTPGRTSSQSMPIDNGDIGLNVWVEPGDDLAFFIGKTDSWAATIILIHFAEISFYVLNLNFRPPNL
jgi:hypothetical protein